MKHKKYLITSANNYGNVGDDICGYSAQYMVKSIDPEASVIVTQPPFRKNLMKDTDVVIVGGGGVIYDGDYQNVENYMSYIEWAQENNKKSIVLGVGVQGIHSEGGKERYLQALSSADLVTVRSPDDEKLLRNIGVTNVVATQDLAFLTDKWVKKPSLVDRLRLKLGMKKNGKPNLGIAFVDLVKIKGDNYDDASRNFVESFEGNLTQISRDFNVYLLVHSRDDANYYERLATQYDVTIVPYKNIHDLPRLWAYYHRMNLVIGTRFHSIILACLAGVPIVGIGSEGAKQNRLANYDMPTLKSQRLLLSDREGINDLFSNLKNRYDQSRYVTIPTDELALAKKRARSNVDMLKKIVFPTE